MIFRVYLLLSFFFTFQSLVVAQTSCSNSRLGVQLLGSGGPYSGTTRASTGYLVWREGRAIIMVDTGGGTFVRFGEAGAKLDDLEILAISHLHPDHVSDLPAFMWLSDILRQRPLNIVGPSAGGMFPDIATFIYRLFNSDSGAFPILGGTLGMSGRGIPLNITIVDVESNEPTIVFNDDDLNVSALGVPHSSGGVPNATTPSVAYRVQIGERSMVFGSDQNGSDRKFVDFAIGVDVLVMHFALSTQATESLSLIHATPEVVGRIARDTGAKRLVLSHLMEAPAHSPISTSFSVPRLDENVAIVTRIYSGPVVVAEDLKCVVIE